MRKRCQSYCFGYISFFLLALTFLLAQSALAAQIRLAWDPNTESDLAGYRVYFGTSSRNYGPPINVQNVTVYALTGLTKGQTYYVAVTAYDSSGNESGLSNEVSGVAAQPDQMLVDYDGDGETDISIYRASSGEWWINPSSGSFLYPVVWGGDSTDHPVPGDYDGDGKTDVAVYRASSGTWWILPSSGSSYYSVGWGGDSTDHPVPGDYDGDGKTDVAVYRASSGSWWILPSLLGAPYYSVVWGGDASDISVTAGPLF
jgi:hypothetical protein